MCVECVEELVVREIATVLVGGHLQWMQTMFAVFHHKEIVLDFVMVQMCLIAKECVVQHQVLMLVDFAMALANAVRQLVTLPMEFAIKHLNLRFVIVQLVSTGKHVPLSVAHGVVIMALVWDLKLVIALELHYLDQLVKQGHAALHSVIMGVSVLTLLMAFAIALEVILARLAQTLPAPLHAKMEEHVLESTSVAVLQ